MNNRLTVKDLIQFLLLSEEKGEIEMDDEVFGISSNDSEPIRRLTDISCEHSGPVLKFD